MVATKAALSNMPVLIDSNRPGAEWLRAMFRFYCRKYNCEMEVVGNKYYALGGMSGHAHFNYERSYMQLQVAIINAIASSHLSPQTVTRITIRNYVKNLYKKGR